MKITAVISKEEVQGLVALISGFQTMRAMNPSLPVVLSNDTYTVTLHDAGLSKINTIKALREITFLGLKQSKDMTDCVPCPVLTTDNLMTAESAKKRLQEAGAVAVISAV